MPDARLREFDDDPDEERPADVDEHRRVLTEARAEARHDELRDQETEYASERCAAADGEERAPVDHRLRLPAPR
jgi:hypothetical protein